MKNSDTESKPERRPLPRERRIGPPEDVEVARLAKALGHPVRVTIMRILLGKGECVCGDLVGRLPLAQATVSQHLKVMKDAGWIQGTIDGPRVCYCACPETGRKFLRLLRELAGEEGATS